jgi:hypothetical protein
MARTTSWIVLHPTDLHDDNSLMSPGVPRRRDALRPTCAACAKAAACRISASSSRLTSMHLSDSLARRT